MCCSQMDRSFSSSGNQEPAEGGITVEFADIRSLQILTDRLKCLSHLLRLNISLKERLDAFFVCVKASLAPDDASMQYETMMQNYGQQTQINISRIELLIDRAKGVSLLVSECPFPMKMFSHLKKSRRNIYSTFETQTPTIK